MMPKTIKQRWKDVGVDREGVAKTVFAQEFEHLIIGKVTGRAREIHYQTADALLPLIEKAVREARIDEAGRIQCVCHKRTSLCDRCERIRIMEAGND